MHSDRVLKKSPNLHFLPLTLRNALIILNPTFPFGINYLAHLPYAALATTPPQDPALNQQVYALVFRIMEAATWLT
ncbi:MAG TPA: hypothetical protein VH682_10520 [Gemmataceae bacterium]|jgi:hypothetical protein